MDLLEWIISTATGWAISFIFYVPFTIMGALGALMPECSAEAMTLFSQRMQNYIVNGVQFWWPVASWLPWDTLWLAFQVWFVYVVFKFMFIWVPRLIHWIVIFIGGIIP